MVETLVAHDLLVLEAHRFVELRVDFKKALEDVYARGVDRVRVEFILRNVFGPQVEILRVHAREKVMGLFERPDVGLPETDDHRLALLRLRRSR